MLPLLIIFNPKQPRHHAKFNQIVFYEKYVPDGIEDGTPIGDDVFIWKTKDTINILSGANVYTEKKRDDEREVIITVNNNKEVIVKNDTLLFVPVNSLVTEEVLITILTRQNERMLAKLLSVSDASKYQDAVMGTACKSGSSGCVKALMENTGLGPDKGLNGVSVFTPLHVASMNGNTAVVKLLVEKFNAEVNRKEDGIVSALGWAIACNQLPMVKMLLQLGAGRENIRVPKVGVVKQCRREGWIVNMGSWGTEEMVRYLEGEGLQWKVY